MNCTEAREALLEADPAALAGTDDSPLSVHLRSCATCRRHARAVLEAERALAAALTATGPRQPVHDALRTARTRATSQAALRGRLWRIGAPLALAAGIGGLVLVSNGQPPAPPEHVVRTEATLPPFHVQGPPDRTVTVFHTADPNIVVIWYF